MGRGLPPRKLLTSKIKVVILYLWLRRKKAMNERTSSLVEGEDGEKFYNEINKEVER